MSHPEHKPKAMTEELQAFPKADPRWRQRRQLLLVAALTGSVMVIEGVAGFLTQSLALISDSLHIATDLFGTCVSILAIQLALRQAPPEKTYRYWRVEILAAMFNGILLLPLVGFLFYEAYRRFYEQVQIKEAPMLAAASLGLCVNLFCATILRRSSEKDLNIRSAFVHLLTDTVSSIGVILAGILVMATHHTLIDPAVGVLIGVLVLFWSLKLIWESATILLESAPRGVKIEDVQAAIQTVQGVEAVHDIHLWVITSRMYALTAHVVVGEDWTISKTDELSREINDVLDKRFDITHTCLQFEAREKA